MYLQANGMVGTCIVTEHWDVPMEKVRIAFGHSQSSVASQCISYLFHWDVPTLGYNACTCTKYQVYKVYKLYHLLRGVCGMFPFNMPG